MDTCPGPATETALSMRFDKTKAPLEGLWQVAPPFPLEVGLVTFGLVEERLHVPCKPLDVPSKATELEGGAWRHKVGHVWRCARVERDLQAGCCQSTPIGHQGEMRRVSGQSGAPHVEFDDPGALVVHTSNVDRQHTGLESVEDLLGDVVEIIRVLEREVEWVAAEHRVLPALWRRDASTARPAHRVETLARTVNATTQQLAERLDDVLTPVLGVTARTQTQRGLTFSVDASLGGANASNGTVESKHQLRATKTADERRCALPNSARKLDVFHTGGVLHLRIDERDRYTTGTVLFSWVVIVASTRL